MLKFFTPSNKAAKVLPVTSFEPEVILATTAEPKGVPAKSEETSKKAKVLKSDRPPIVKKAVVCKPKSNLTSVPFSFSGKALLVPLYR